MSKDSIQALAQQGCQPCEGDVKALGSDEITRLQRSLGHGWRIVDNHHLEKEFKFTNFREALEFVNKVGELAESKSHHPDLYLAWGKTKVTLWTHKIDGLTESDFAMAAMIEGLAEG